MFVGRKNELDDLEREWERGTFAMPVIYGRRRVGKTMLLEKFAEGKDGIFFTPSLNEDDNIAELARLSREAGIETTGENLRQIFRDIFSAAKIRRLLFIIDEYPYLEYSRKGISSELQKLIDKNLSSRLFIILCGSSMNFMKRQVLSYESPLFGRRTSQILVEPFTLFESLQLLNESDFVHACELYGLVDGTPAYLERLDTEKSLRENLILSFLNPYAYLFEESEALLKQELRQPEMHAAILRTIGYKSLTEKEVVDKMRRFDIDGGQCVEMIENLADIDILQKVSAWKEPKKSVWEIRDCYFSFWHTFMPRVFQAVKNHQPEMSADFILKTYSDYMGSVFEKICVQWLKKESRSGNLPIDLKNTGKWWGNDRIKKEQAEIDIVADSFDGDMLFAECKWQNEPMDTNQMDKLVHRSQFVKKSKDCRRIFYFFSKSGFTPQMVKKAAKMNDCQLVALSDMDNKNNFSPESLSFSL